MGTAERGMALVIGGSMAGLVAGRVLANHFDRVVILERDSLTGTNGPRRGVPQGRHAHAMLAGGLSVLVDLFPGFINEIASAGAIVMDPANDGDWFFEGNALRRAPSGTEAILLSRPFLEADIRRRVSTLENLSIKGGVSVRNLLVDGGTVKGVVTDAGEIAADLVVDASGRGSQGPKWLDEMGFERPPEERVEVQLTYTTRRFKRKRGDLDGDKFLVIPPTPQGKRGGVALTQEGNCWIVTLFGHFGESAPEELNGYSEFARSLPCNKIYHLIANTEPVDDACTLKFPASTRRRYEKLDRFPDGFLVFGDAICSFNPIYGQGMSASALQANALDQTLEQGIDALPSRFFRKAQKVIDGPWSVAVGGDLKMPETVGPRSRGVDFINWYLAKLHKAGHSDATAANAFIRVAQMLEQPPSILAPSIAFRVFKHSVFGSRTRR